MSGAGKREELATYKIKVNGIERVAVMVGPLAMGCWWNCLGHVEERTKPGDATTPAKRQLVETERKQDFSLAVALHVTVVAWENWGLGAILGYPLSPPDGTSLNILTGAGLRHESGLELALGVHLYSLAQLRSEYEALMPIDLDAMGNQALTPDDVTSDRVNLAFFALLGFAPDIF